MSYTIHIETDDDLENPLHGDWPAGVEMYLYSRRNGFYGTDSAEKWGRPEDYNSWDDFREAVEDAAIEDDDEILCFQGVLCHQHGGIQYYTGTSSSDRWDTGRAGWIAIRLKDFEAEWGSVWESPAARYQAAEKMLDACVRHYSAYANGEGKGWVIRNETGEPVESCWGYISEEDAQADAERALAALLEREFKRHGEQLPLPL